MMMNNNDKNDENACYEFTEIKIIIAVVKTHLYWTSYIVWWINLSQMMFSEYDDEYSDNEKTVRRLKMIQGKLLIIATLNEMRDAATN